jgi:outer membrane receptor protein involved in Fe transport
VATTGSHLLNFSFIGAPQEHNQARAAQDLALLDQLGWEYNRNNHPYQENYYFKPQFSLRHEWIMSEKQNLATNYFATFGRGGGRYLRNDNFDVETGDVGFKDLSESTDNKYFGRNAWYIYDITNGAVVLDGFDPSDTTFNGEPVSRSSPLIAGSFAHSWKNDSQNHHNQFGINTVYRHELNDMVTGFLGGEARLWMADHFAETFNFRSSDADGNLVEYEEAERRYDYSTTVTNLSGFARLQLRPFDRITLMADGQFASYTSKVEENPIEIFDFEAGEFTGETYKTTEDMRDSDGQPLFSEDDYDRTFNFFSPKVGANYNLTDEINVLANYSIAYKEPEVRDWYDRADGPTFEDDEESDLDPEKATNLEFGLGYGTEKFSFNANYYRINFEDKIESIVDRDDNSITTNAGKALHQGIEVAATGVIGQVDYAASWSWARNRWEEMNLNELFDEPAEDIVDKVVPFSPELMRSFAFGYTTGPIRIGVSSDWWDEYYGSYTNEYTLIDGTVVPAKLPAFFQLNADISYELEIAGTEVLLRLDLNNLTNRQNFTRAEWSTDYNRNDDLAGQDYMYVGQAPLFNAFFTTEIRF